MILVAPAGQRRVEAVCIELIHHASQQARRHGAVVYQTQGKARAAALDAFRDFLKQTVAQVVVDFHLGVAREFETVCFVVVEVESWEQKGQATAHHVVEIHKITAPVAVRQAHKASHATDRKGQEGVVVALDAFTAHLDSQVDAVVRFAVKAADVFQPDRSQMAGQFAPEKVVNKAALFIVDLSVVDQADMLPPQLLGDRSDGLAVFLGVAVVKLIYLAQQCVGLFLFIVGGFVLTFGDTADTGHADTEKLVEVVRIDTEE